MNHTNFLVKTFPLHKRVKPSNKENEFVLIQITAPKTFTREHPALDAVLVLDVSGSMRGEPLSHVIRSAQKMADLLSEKDSLGIVAFGPAARQVSPLRKLSRESRKLLKQEVSTLKAGGGTNMSGGLAHGALLFDSPQKDRRQIALLLSDGHPNMGSRTKEEFEAEVALLKRREIAISTLGFGASHNEDILLAIAEAGGGCYSFVSEPRLANASFARALGAQRDVIADQVKLVLRPSPGVEVLRILGEPKLSFSAEGIQLNLQDLMIEDELNILVELSLKKSEESANVSLLSTKLIYRFIETKEPKEIQEIAALSISKSEAELTRPHVQSQVSIALAAELREKAQSLADQRNFSGAKALLEKAKEIIEKDPSFVLGENTPIADAWETLVDDISAMERNPDPEEYSEFKKSQRDYLNFASHGTRKRQGGFSISPSAQKMVDGLYQEPLPKARLVILEGNKHFQTISLDKPVYNIGRVHGNDIVLPKGNVSKRNTKIVYSDGNFCVVDLKSTNGTSINGNVVNHIQALAHNDKIHIGDWTLCFELDS